MRTSAFFFALSIVFVASAYPIDPPRDRERWTSIDADEFSIFSNAGDRETSGLATNLLTMREALGQITRLEVRSAIPTRVYIFRNEGDFAPYRDLLLKRRGAHVVGLFLRTRDMNFILLQADAPGGIDRAIYHELTHDFVSNSVTGTPLWFNEGLAEYYSTFSTKGDDVNLGIPVTDHLRTLQNTLMIPLPQLFSMTTSAPDYNEGIRQGIFYAESWALVHYLMGDAERREKLKTFLALARIHRPIDEAFQTAFGSTYDKMESELRGYVRRFLLRYTRYSLADLHVRIPVPQPMPRDAVLVHLGYVLEHSGRDGLADAQRFLTTATTVNPNSGAAWAELAQIHEASGRSADATVEFDKAVQFGGNDPTILLMYGGALLDRISKSSQALSSTPSPLVLKAPELFQKAAELDPTSARAYAGIGATYIADPTDPAHGVDALEKSLSLAPGQQEAAFDLVQLYARQGRPDDASRLAETVIASGDNPEMLRKAREAVSIANVEKAQKLLRDGKAAEAEAVLRPLAATATNPQIRTYAEQTIAEIDRRKALDQQLEQLRSAGALATEGKIAEALELVDKILPTISDPELLERAKKFRELLIKSRARSGH